MNTRIQKWGNSLAIRLSKAVIEESGLNAGAEVTVTANGTGILIKPSRQKRRRVPIKELVRGMKPGQYRYRHFDDGPVGKEVI